MSARPVLLLISHSYYNRAGVEEHIKTLAAYLGQAYDIHIVFPHQGQIVHLTAGQEVQRFPAENISFFSPLRAPQAEAALTAIINRIKPDLVHLVHFLGWPLAVFDLLSRTGIPAVFSQHDYFSITPFYTLQGQDPLDTLSAAYSLKYFGQDHSEYLKKRRAFLENAFQIFKAKIVPSLYLARTLNKIFPADYQIIPYGIPAFDCQPSEPSKVLRFGFTGSLLLQKGWQVLHQAFDLAAQDLQGAELHFFGGDRPDNLPPVSNVYFHGVYNQPDLPAIMSRFDIGIVPSVFPETYSIVLSELWQAGKAVAVSNIGALAERTQDFKNARVFAPANIQQLSEVLKWFVTSSDWRNWPPQKPVSADNMAQLYSKTYQLVLA